MNLQARKFIGIDCMIGINVERITQEQLIQRAIQSNLDFSRGKVKTQKQIKSELQYWVCL